MVFGTTISEAIRSHNQSLYFKQANANLSQQRQRLLNNPTAVRPGAVAPKLATPALFASSTGFAVPLDRTPPKLHHSDFFNALFNPFHFMSSLYKRMAMRAQMAQEEQYFRAANQPKSWIA